MLPTQQRLLHRSAGNMERANFFPNTYMGPTNLNSYATSYTIVGKGWEQLQPSNRDV